MNNCAQDPRDFDVNVLLVSTCTFNPLGIGQLHSFLSQRGYTVKTLFFKGLQKNPTKKEWRLLAEFVRKNKFDLVGISVQSGFFYIATEIAKIIKQNSDAVVVFGGIQATLQPEFCLKYSDVVCIGDGEYPLKELIDSMRNNKPDYKIKGLWFKKGKKIIKNELRELSNLDDYSFTDYSDDNKFTLEHNHIYPRHVYQNTKGNYYITTTRGCPFSCTYCCNSCLRNIFKNKGDYLRRRSVDNVIKELKFAKAKYHPKLIQFWDDVFTFDLKWISEFAEKYKKEVSLPFFCYADPRSCPESIIGLLVPAGLVQVDMGIQTGSERIRSQYYNRHETNDQIVKAAQLFKKYGLHSCFNLMIENPYETEYDKRETLNLLFRLPKPVRVSISSLTFFPIHPLTERALKDKKTPQNVLKIAQDKMLSTRYAQTISVKRNKQDLFWNMLYTLIMAGVPNKVVNRLSYSKLIREHAVLIAYALEKLISINNYVFYKLPKRTIADKVKKLRTSPTCD